jgi:predicted branched-subunit amino acid permease
VTAPPSENDDDAVHGTHGADSPDTVRDASHDTGREIDPAVERTAALRQSLAVGVATGVYGVSFGALSVAAGLDVWATVALSALMFTGGSQFAYVAVIGSGGSGAAAIATASLLGVRNGVYGLQLVPTLATRGVRRLAAAQLTIDESTAVSIAQRTPPAARIGFWATGLTVFVCWNAMTLVGALLGDALGDPRQYGLDAMAAAAFLALLWPRLSASRPRAVAAGAAVVAAACVPTLPAGVPVLVAGLVAVGAGLLGASRDTSGRKPSLPPPTAPSRA